VAADVPGWLRPLVAAAAGVRAEDLSRFVPPGAGERASAVLVLFGEGPAGPDVLLIERAATLRSHAGQPAFPGGALDPGEGAVDAALREAAEETGLDPAGVDVLAVLPDLWIPFSGYAVTPVLAWWREPSDVGPTDALEVAAVVRVPLAELAAASARVRVRHPAGGEGPGFEVRGLLVWGFTAGLLARLLELGGLAPYDASNSPLRAAPLPVARNESA
jgi:8-oxo-dGTP pyrophosphatase MutT (NUDIX family)